MKNPRLLIVGWDGADYSIADQWLTNGQLPNLERLLSSGTRATLRSTRPPMTPVAWPTLFTGLNPGRHGVLRWTTGPFGTGSVVDRRHVRGLAFWDVFQQMGLKSLVCSVPLSFPPHLDSDNCMIGSWLEPGSGVQVYPLYWAEHIEREFGRLPQYPFRSRRNLSRFKERYEETARKITDVFLFTLAEGGFEVGFIVYPHTDHYMHFRFDLFPAYEIVDQCLGRLLDSVDRNTPIILLSDHGTRQLCKSVHLNRWLQEKGLLHLKQFVPIDVLSKRLYKRLRRQTGVSEQTAHRLLAPCLRLWRHLPPALKRVATKQIRRRYGFTEEEIDLARTRAVFSLNGIFVFSENRHGFGTLAEREAQELEAWLRREITSLKDPHTNQPVFASVLSRSEVCWGPSIEGAADFYPVKSSAEYFIVENSIPRDTQPEPIVEYSTDFVYEDHSLEGILAIRAEGVPEGHSVSDQSIIDVYPTLFYLLGLPVPRHIDGHVMVDLFYSDWLSSHELEFCDVNLNESETIQLPIGDDDLTIMRRLSDLGYL